MNAPKPPAVLVVPEPDYCYGVGQLRLRVEHIDVANPVAYDGELWYRVRGMQIRADGVEVQRDEVLVRGRRLPPQGHPGTIVTWPSTGWTCPAD